MKRIASIILALALMAPVADAAKPTAKKENSNTVWVCGGPKSKRYHKNKNCPGLSRCSKTPRQVSLKEAKSSYTPCRKCS